MPLPKKLALLTKYPEYALPGVSKSTAYLIFSVATISLIALTLFIVVSATIPTWTVALLVVPFLLLAYMMWRNIKPNQANLSVSDPSIRNTTKDLKCLFSQFQPLLEGVDLLQTPQGNWVGLGHQNKVKFARDVTISSFLMEAHPDIFSRPHKSEEEYYISLKSLPEYMSTHPLRSIQAVHYQYAVYNDETQSLSISDARKKNSFPITYLQGKDFPQVREEVIEHDTQLHKIIER